jgi:hypothetical protein
MLNIVHDFLQTATGYKCFYVCGIKNAPFWNVTIDCVYLKTACLQGNLKTGVWLNWEASAAVLVAASLCFASCRSFQVSNAEVDEES